MLENNHSHMMMSDVTLLPILFPTEMKCRTPVDRNKNAHALGKIFREINRLYSNYL